MNEDLQTNDYKYDPMSNISFRIMSFFFRIRDFFKPPSEKLEKFNIKNGDYVLDYGCGPGSYTIEAAKMVNSNGKVYAADIHPIAIKKVKKKAQKENLKNITTILIDHKIGLENNSVDIIICFDVLHEVQNQQEVLKEFHRLLKPNGLLAFDDHHFEEKEIIDKLTSQNLFFLKEKMDGQYLFLPLNHN
jgi:ubiquinone/menaquinone biosynthesis C-methylase UbiE